MNDSAPVFADHFSTVAQGYSEFRPNYPGLLFDALKTHADAVTTAGNDPVVWDCAAGTGQASVPLGDRFHSVLATDASVQQLAAATSHCHVHYAAATAEQCPLQSDSVGLITVAQALHWFRFDAFFAEARRVLVPGGLIAAWGYGLLRVSSNVDLERLIHEFSEITVGPWWPPERAHINSGYSTIPFPFEPISMGSFDMRAHWTRAQLFGYLRTWSSVSRGRKATGVDPVLAFEVLVEKVWGPATTLEMRWPLTILAGRRD